MDTQIKTVFLEIEICCSCGVPFGIEAQYRKKLKEEHKSFYCPNGHSQYYPAKNKAEILEEQMQRERAQADQIKARLRDTERSLIATRGQVTRIKNRVKAGICTCCNRYFVNLHRHMQTKHSEEKKA